MLVTTIAANFQLLLASKHCLSRRVRASCLRQCRSKEDNLRTENVAPIELAAVRYKKPTGAFMVASRAAHSQPLSDTGKGAKQGVP